MRLLDRYLLRELFLPLSYCLGGFLIFWISFDLINEISHFQKHGLSFLDIAEYYLVTTPELLLVVMPIALLLALLYALTTHARANELTAMRAAGISLWRLAMPYFAVGILFSAAYLLINELWVPNSIEKADEIENRYETKKADAAKGHWRRNLKFLNARDNRAWWIKAYNVKTSQMRDVLIDWRSPEGKRTVIAAREGIFSDGVWRFNNVAQSAATDIGDVSVFTNQIEFSGWAETPALIKSEIKITGLNSKQAAKKPQLSIADISNYLRLHPQLDRDARALISTQLHARIAWPVTCLVVVFIALPFGAITSRRNVFVGVASSIFICFSFFILMRVGLALGTSNRLPGWLAAWLPNFLFGGGAIWLTLRLR